MTAPRTESFGQGYAPTPVDRFGVWLSARQIRRWIPTFRGLHVADLGCGFNATFSRTVLDEVERAVLVDVAIAPDLKAHAKVHALEGGLPETLAGLPAHGLDAVMIVSVLEHLTRPLETLQEILRVLKPGGTCLVNVPSWRGKTYLELAAFKLGVAPAAEMNDHKMYYDVRDLWPVLVKAGFRPSDINCFSHKFGLNTFAACTAPGAP
jgi:SAM-dependent methyltransferase